MSQFVVAVGSPSFEFLGLVSRFADQDRDEGDDEEGGVEVGHKVRFAVCVVCEDCLEDVDQSSMIAKGIFQGWATVTYTG